MCGTTALACQRLSVLASHGRHTPKLSGEDGKPWEQLHTQTKGWVLPHQPKAELRDSVAGRGIPLYCATAYKGKPYRLSSPGHGSAPSSHCSTGFM